MSTGGTQLRFDDALSIAVKLVAELEPVCVRVKLAGSLRRRKPLVSDLEVLVEPKEFTADLFGTRKHDVETIRSVLYGLGTPVKGGDRYIQITDTMGVAGLKTDVFVVVPPYCVKCRVELQHGKTETDIQSNMRRVRDRLPTPRPLSSQGLQQPVSGEAERKDRTQLSEGSVRDVRHTIHLAEVHTDEDLLSGMCKETGDAEAESTESQELPVGEGARARMDSGTPIRRGTENRKTVESLGACAPSERKPEGQSASESGDRLAQTSQRDSDVPALSEGFSTALIHRCPACGGRDFGGASWGSILAIRTGPRDLSQLAVTQFRRHGLHHEGGKLWTNSGAFVPTPSEEDFFRYARLPYYKPGLRDRPEAKTPLPASDDAKNLLREACKE